MSVLVPAACYATILHSVYSVFQHPIFIIGYLLPLVFIDETHALYSVIVALPCFATVLLLAVFTLKAYAVKKYFHYFAVLKNNVSYIQSPNVTVRRAGLDGVAS